MTTFLEILLKVGAGVVVAILFGLAVFIHEFGHFIAARLLGLKVDVFSIGFGPAIWKRRKNGIEYQICCIPLGGYVALPQLDPAGMEKIQGDHESKDAAPQAPLPEIPAWRRVVVALAGPFGNIVLAVFLAWLIYFLPQARIGGPDTIVGDVPEGSAAAEAGFMPDDQILAVNGTRVASWNDFVVECHLSGDVTNGVRVLVQRAGGEVELSAMVAPDSLFETLRIDGLSRKTECLVGAVNEGSAAQSAGILPGDIIASCGGEVLTSPTHMVSLVTAAGENPVTLGILRGSERLELTMTPRFDEEAGRPLIGVLFANPDAKRSPWLVYRNPWRQLKADAGSIVRVLRALVAPRAKGEAGRAAGALGGPVMIFFLLWSQVMAGLVNSLAFLRFLCVNLAILNLLPLPVLDGGHILFAFWEIVTHRKPHPKFVSIVTNAFACLLIGLMLLLVFRDALNLRKIFKPRDAADSSETKEFVFPTPEDIPSLSVPATTNAPAIDGEISAGEWDGAAVIDTFRPPLLAPERAQFAPATVVRVSHDAEYLYVSFECTDDDIDCTGAYSRHDAEIYKEDVTEVYLDAAGDGRCFVELVVAPDGTTLDCLHTFARVPTFGPDLKADAESREGMLDFLEWEMEGLQIAASRTATGWSSEFAIPFATLPRPAQEGSDERAIPRVYGPAPETIRAQFVRYDRLRKAAPNKNLLHQTWSTICEGSPHVSPSRMGFLSLE